ncbi:hypothetical protein QYE76_043142 [Lolium multiflorum]|uniref:Dirigent protein n=1 Tax=Lolium multiflorum TaxID=4521 RepID=A0AAD8WVT7_LOLMU|nr:hypothetical protein QYE76_043142 [Lolium multiflorum]
MAASSVVSLSSAARDAIHGAVGAEESHHMHMYMHDFSTGPNPSAVVVARGTGTGPTLRGSVDRRFGDTLVMDDALTDGPGPASRALGRAQGFYVAASSAGGDPAVLVSMNVLLTSGPYNGSTLAVSGRNAVLAQVRELSVVGGTGRFRMARGYVLMKTASWIGNDAVLELDIFVHA